MSGASERANGRRTGSVLQSAFLVDLAHCVQLPKAEANSVWSRLARAAMEALDVAFAIRVYRHIGDVGMVVSLSKIEQVREGR